jgi:predicted HAD superfamily Cof-like phosphohydrolase
MKKQIDQVEDFHNAFGIENSYSPTADIGAEQYMLRYELIREENEEYLDACQRGDITEIADALGDQLYILCGTMLKHGLQERMEAIFDEIHRSNMSKLGEDGKPIYREDGKVMKGPAYFKPDISRYL